jgi:glutathione S-transferase
MIELFSLSYSPWSEKARWALDHHAVDYREKQYEPIIGEPWMRIRQRKASGPVSVPALFDGKTRCTDSWAIALYADRVGSGARLFPEGETAAIQEIDDLSERGLRSGRALALERVLQSNKALTEMLPKPMRGLGSPGRAIAAFGIRRTLRKYGASALASSEHEAELVAVLDEMRARLGRGISGGSDLRYLVRGRLTYADISAAQVLHWILPVLPIYRCVRIGSANRVCFEHPTLSRTYHDLIAWRDALYARHRGSRTRVADAAGERAVAATG